MATLDTGHFGLQLSNLGLQNLREEFNTLLGLFRSERFRAQFRKHRDKQIPVRTHYFTWAGRPEELLSHILRDAIISAECAVSGAVFVESILRGVADENIRELTKNPHKSGGRGTADCVFNRLPALLDESWPLATSDPELWSRVQDFYRDVRNPLFHAYEVVGSDPEPVWKCLEFIWELFQWINTWHSAEKLAALVPIRPSGVLAEIPRIDETRVEQIVPERRVLGDEEYLQNLPEGTKAPVGLEDVKGMLLAPEPRVDFTVIDEQGENLKLRLSAHAAMKLLGFLAIAHQQRGWQIPDPLW